MDDTRFSDQIGGMMNKGLGAAMHAKRTWTAAGIMAGVVLAGAGAYLLWNSRQAKMLRTAKRTGKVLRRTGAILQAVAEATE